MKRLPSTITRVGFLRFFALLITKADGSNSGKLVARNFYHLVFHGGLRHDLTQTVA
jgi:hypothetical protein